MLPGPPGVKHRVVRDTRREHQHGDPHHLHQQGERAA
jgi:hypothetical protein